VPFLFPLKTIRNGKLQEMPWDTDYFSRDILFLGYKLIKREVLYGDY